MITEERLLLQQQRDHEGQAIREAIVGQAQMIDPLAFPQEQEMDEELDLATLPQYEEYR